MSRIRVITDTRLSVDLRPAGDFGSVSMSGATRSSEEAQRLAEAFADAIRRHCAEHLPSRSFNRAQGVHIVHEYEYVCSHCGEPWGASSEYGNPECCPAAWAEEAKGALEEVGEGLRLIPDGDQFALVGPGFVNLQESDVIAWIPSPSLDAAESASREEVTQ